MIVFIIPLMPSNFRSELRDKLWELCRSSLIKQKNKNWKAILIGDDFLKQELDCENFIYIEGDLYTKKEKLNKALQKMDVIFRDKPEYIMRLDCDDIISPFFLDQFYALNSKCDLYSDKYHVCIDPIYMSISYRNANWITNSSVHKFEHAISKYGPNNEPLFIIDHAVYWKKYYADKKIVYTNMLSIIYYRILSPFSISSNNSKIKNTNQVNDYDFYLKGFGPWIVLKRDFFMFAEISEVSKMLEAHKNERTVTFRIFNYVKHCVNFFLNKQIER